MNVFLKDNVVFFSALEIYKKKISEVEING